MKTVIDKFGEDEPVLFYTWTPNWTLHELQVGVDVVWIGVPEVDQLPPLPDPISDIEGCVNNPCRMGFSSNDIHVVANRQFLEANPSAAKLFEIMSIPLADIASQNARMIEGENTREHIDNHAAEWVKDHQSLTDGWIAQAKGADQ